MNFRGFPGLLMVYNDQSEPRPLPLVVMMWSKWCAVLIVVLVVNLSRCAEGDGEEEEEEEEEGPSTPRPPPPIPLKNMTELVKMYGHEAEEYEVKMPDGQKLGLFHIKPKAPGGPVVLIQHGVGMAPDAWCITNKSLAYLLTESGADVWLPSMRGNVFSRKHEKYDPNKDKEFWEFSLGEVAEMDLPAMIDFILDKTRQPSLYYIGHSIGTSVALIALSKRPQYNAKIKEAIMLGPIWHCTKYQFMVNKESSVYQMILGTWKQWDEKQKWEAFPRADVSKTEHQLRCEDLPEMATPYCEMGLDMTYNAVGEYVPSGLGVKLMKHLAQAYVNGKMGPWDFDTPELNKKAYNQETPPEYDLKKITTKVHLIYAKNDQLVDSNDVEKLAGDLTNVVKELIEGDSFNHPDFVTPSDAENEPLTTQLRQKLVSMVKK